MGEFHYTEIISEKKTFKKKEGSVLVRWLSGARCFAAKMGCLSWILGNHMVEGEN